MLRRLFVLLLVAGLLFVLWGGARWFRHSGDLRATVVFDEATHLERGAPVLQGDEPIGTVEKVSPMGDQEAIAIRVDRDKRNALRTDSLLRVDGRSLVVDSNFAVGRPAEDRAVLHARDSRLARMLEQGSAAVAPRVRQAKEKAAALISSDRVSFERELDGWTARLPQWKTEGRESWSRHLDEVKQKAAQAEESLRRAGKNLEADQVRARAASWIDAAKRRISSDE